MRGRALPAVLALLSGASAAADLETACDALPAAANVRVLFKPAAVQIDDSKLAREIKLDGDKATAFRHLGVTRATLERNVDVRLDGYTDERAGRACAWPRVTIRLSVQPLRVELARELNASECLRAHVLEHEMQHVAIYNAGTLRAASQLEREMRGRLNERRLDGDPDALMRDLRAQVTDQWLARLDALLADADREHEALDAAEERQAYAACNGALSQLIKAIE